jgi:tetratricopeptide (TPR) repeat protein
MRNVRAGALEGLADLATNRGDFVRADSLYHAALEARLEYLSEAHPEVARTRWGLAFVNIHMDRPEVAEEISRQNIATLIEAYGPNHNDVAFGYVYLGIALGRQDRLAEAANAFLRAAEISGSVNVPGHPATADAWRRYGEAMLSQGLRDDAMRAFQESRRVYSVGFEMGVDSAEVGNDVAGVDTLLAVVLFNSHRIPEALEHLRDARAVAQDRALIERLDAKIDSLGRAGKPITRSPGL